MLGRGEGSNERREELDRYMMKWRDGVSQGMVGEAMEKRIMEVESLLPKIGFSLGVGAATAISETNELTTPRKYVSYYQLASHMHNLSNNIKGRIACYFSI